MYHAILGHIHSFNNFVNEYFISYFIVLGLELKINQLKTLKIFWPKWVSQRQTNSIGFGVGSL